jgi:hypothetical protein
MDCTPCGMRAVNEGWVGISVGVGVGSDVGISVGSDVAVETGAVIVEIASSEDPQEISVIISAEISKVLNLFFFIFPPIMFLISIKFNQSHLN